MIRKLTTLAAAFALAAAALAPAAAEARDRRDGYYERHHDDHYGRRYHDDYYDHRRRDRRHDDDDAVAAGVIGLVLGLALGAAASQPRPPQARCYDNYRRCEPPQGYDPYYRRGDSAYERDYGAAPPPCTRRERQWDRYSGRYVVIDVPC